MAECVSCGKGVPDGELFCRECLSRMKGRASRISGVAAAVEGSPGEGTVPRVQRSPGRGEGSSGRESPGGEEIPGDTPRVRGELTPAREKKVVSLRPGLEEKKAERSAFRITITLSERGYRLLSRLGLGDTEAKKEGKGRAKKGKVAYLKPVPGFAGDRPLAPRQAGVGRPSERSGPLGSLRRYLAPRRRDWDRSDRASALVIFATSLLAAVLVPLQWVRVEWLVSGEASPQVAGVRGYQLGPWSYLILVLALADLFYLLAWVLLRRPPLPLDFGSLSLLAGFLGIAFFNLALSSNYRIIRAAASAAGIDPQFLVSPQVGLSRYTQLPAYLVLLCLIAMPLAGLARLSRRE